MNRTACDAVIVIISTGSILADVVTFTLFLQSSSPTYLIAFIISITLTALMMDRSLAITLNPSLCSRPIQMRMEPLKPSSPEKPPKPTPTHDTRGRTVFSKGILRELEEKVKRKELSEEAYKRLRRLLSKATRQKEK